MSRRSEVAQIVSPEDIGDSAQGPFRLLVPPRLRAYVHVLEARASERLELVPLPRACHLVVTWQCNSRCQSCAAWQRPADDELSAAEWRQVFKRLRCLDMVKLIGGEPFFRADLEDILVALREEINPFVVQLVTNGLLPERVRPFLMRQAWPGLHLRVSLDGLKETHDASRGVSGAYEKVVETLEAAADVRRKRRFRIGVNFTLTDRSLPEMDTLVALCERLKVDVIPGFPVKPFLRHVDPAKEKMSVLGVSDGEAHLRRLEQTDHGARRGFNLLEQQVLRRFNKTVYHKHVEGKSALKFRCAELRHLLYLMPNGDVVTCGLKHAPVGNLLQQPLEQIWRGQKIDVFRQEVDACPGCLQGAVELMSRLYRGKAQGGQ